MVNWNSLWESVFKKPGAKEDKTASLLRDYLAFFKAWMVENGLSESTAKSYLSAIAKVSEIALSNGLTKDPISLFEDPKEVNKVKKALGKDPDFIKINEDRHNALTAALNKFQDFKASSASLEEECDKFTKWLEGSGLSAASLKNYKYALVKVRGYVLQAKLAKNDLLLITDSKKLATIKAKAAEQEEFLEMNKKTSGACSAVLTKYCDYRA